MIATHDILHHIDFTPLQPRFDILTQFVDNLASQDLHSAHHSERTALPERPDGPGKLRIRSMTMAVDGLPTCAHCSQQFTTWHNFYLHVEYHCPMTSWQDLPSASVEQRHGILLEALMSGADHLAEHSAEQQHLLTHCGLCGRFCGHTTALHRHWAHDHPAHFEQHGAYMPQLLHSSTRRNPCIQCGLPCDERHNCVLIRQLAMLAASLELPIEPVPDAPFETSLFRCRYCPKLYITSHGRNQHEESAHRRQSPSTLTDAMRQLLNNAVQRNECELILPCPALLQALNHECALCGFQTQRRNSLTRHFRQAHSGPWQLAEQLLLELIPRFQRTHECSCDPPSTQRKHQCMVYIQFALLRAVASPCPDETMVTQPQTEPPFPTAFSLSGIVECALHIGLIHQVLPSDTMQRYLTHVCILCDEEFSDTLALSQHHRDIHPELWSQSWNRTDILQRTHRGASPCICDCPDYMQASHFCCPGFRQLAIASLRAPIPVLVPECVSKHHLCHMLHLVLTMEQIEQINTLVQCRDFETLIHLPWLHLTLSGFCVLCQQHLDPEEMQAHVSFAHPTIDPLIRSTRVDICETLHVSEPSDHCSLCGMEHHLEYTNMDEFAPPHIHYMCNCPVTLQLAIILCSPHLLKDVPSQTKSSTPTFPKIQLTISEALNSASISRSKQTSPWTMFIQSIQQMLMQEDPCQQFLHTCLICGRFFFHAKTMIQHLLQHITHHTWFQTFVRILCSASTPHCPTTPCTDAAHLPLSLKCPVILNLGVFLAEQYGRGSRRTTRCPDGRNLAACSPSRRPEKSPVRIPSRAFTSDQAPKRPRSECRPQPNPPAPDEADSPPRGRPQHPTDGMPICDSFSNRSRQCSAIDVGTQQEMAHGECAEAGSLETCAGTHFHWRTSEEIAGAHIQVWRPTSPEDHAGGASVGRPSDDAVPFLECEEPEAGSLQRDTPSGATGHHHLGTDPDPDGQPIHHLEIPRSQTHGACSPAEAHLDPVHLADQQSTQLGALAQNPFLMLSFHLAACESSSQTALGHTQPYGNSAPTTCEVNPDGRHVRAVRLLLNPSQTACYANAVIQALAWVTLCSDSFNREDWHKGLELMIQMTELSPMPLNLRHLDSFTELLTRDWTVNDLLQQQDSNEFCQFVLERTRPRFIHCDWAPLLAHRGVVLDERDGENGSPYFPIGLNLPGCPLEHPTLQQLINAWFDIHGHQRCLHRMSPGVCFRIERGSEQGLCETQINNLEADVTLPVYDQLRDQVRFPTYTVAAYILHSGPSLHQGHYRASLRTDHAWFLYDDCKLPHKTPNLYVPPGYRVIMAWLSLHSAHATDSAPRPAPSLVHD